MTYQLGLILLMYCSGAQLRSIMSQAEGRPVAAISIIGSVLPFVGRSRAGPQLGRRRTDSSAAADDRVAFALVFALAMAVTSIPVISRIMADLNLLGTRFARVVLSVAVLEDVAVYVLLNIALSRVATSGSASTAASPDLLDLGRHVGERSGVLRGRHPGVLPHAAAARHRPSWPAWPRCAAT